MLICFILTCTTIVGLAQEILCDESFLSSNWSALGPMQDDFNSISRVTGLWVDENSPSTIYIGTRGSGIWKTTDGGDNWSNQFSDEIASVGVNRIVNAEVFVSGPDYSTTAIYGYGVFGSYMNQLDISLVYYDPFLAKWKREDWDNYPWGFQFEVGRFDVGYYAMAKQEGEYKLWIGNTTKVFIRNTYSNYVSPTENNYEWEEFPILDLDFDGDSGNDKHSIKDIVFAPGSANVVVITPFDGSDDDLLFANNATSISPSWQAIPVPSISLTGSETHYRFGASVSFIDDDNFYVIFDVRTYDASDNDLNRYGYLAKYQVVSGSPTLVSSYPTNKTPNGWTGTWVDLQVADLGSGDIILVGDPQKTLYKADVPSVNGSTCSLVQVSALNFCNDTSVKTHGDVRVVQMYKDDVSSKYRVYIATDGGVSYCDDLSQLVTGPNESVWENLNGNGLNIADFEGLGNSELAPYRFTAASGDGNSHYFDGPGVYGPMVSPCDQIDAAMSKTLPERALHTDNSAGPNGEFIWKFYNATTGVPITTHLKRPYGDAPTDTPPQEYAHAFAHFDFLNDVAGEALWVGTNDVFKNSIPYTSSTEGDWDPRITRAHETNFTPADDDILTNNPVSAFARILKDEEGKFTTYAADLLVRNPRFTPGDIKLTRSETDISNPATQIWEIFDITPNTVIGEPTGYTQIDYAFITDVVAYAYGSSLADTAIWVCFGSNDLNADGGTHEILSLIQGPNSNSRKAKVYYSPDNGDTWYNRSDGLPNYPVIDLEFLIGSDHILFAGTVAGVYVWDDDNNEWDCFNTNLPLASAGSIEINYCSMTLRAALYSYGIWETPLPLGTHFSRPGGQAIEINYDATWNYSRDVGRDIIIKPGASLTIEDCEVRMPKDHRIIVERGAVLKLDNAVITNYCEPWDGIEVWGNSSKAHPVSAAPVLNGTYPAALDDHGVVMVLNGSRIENAKTAIATYKSTPEGPEFGYNGAIVIAEESEFVNNQISVQFMPYDYPEIIAGADVENTDDDNISYFDNCTFTTNEKYFQDGHQEYQILMWDVDGVEIRGCDFINEIAEPVLADLGSAIYSTDATYTVKEAACAVSPCDDSTSIRGYYRGIEAANTSSLPLLDVTVTKTIFEDNVRGVLLSNVAHSSITLNRMQIDNASTTETYGLYLEDCADYQVEENLFKGIGTPGSYPVSAGIYVANNSNAVTEIYNNYFTEVEVGIRSQTVNAKLQIRCNDFVEPINNYNIAVTSGGIPNQGTCGGAVTDPAGNEFSREHNPDGDIRTQSGVSTFKYRHHSDYDYKPDWVTTPIVTLVDCGINASSGEPCPSNLSGGGGTESASMMMGQAEGMEAAIEDLDAMLTGYGAEEALGTDTYLSGMEDLEWLSNQKQLLVMEAANLYMQEGKTDSAVMILLEQDAIWADMQLVDLYINQEDYSSASSILKSLPRLEEGINDHISLYTILIELKNSGRLYSNLSEKETSVIEAIAGKQSPASVAAENILQLINGVDIPEVFDDLGASEVLRYAEDLSDNSAIRIYPNPASTTINIEVQNEMETESYSVTISDSRGVMVWERSKINQSLTSVNVSTWTTGVYLFQVRTSYGITSVQKIVVE